MEQLFIHLLLLFFNLFLNFFLPSSEAVSAPPGAGWGQAAVSLPAGSSIPVLSSIFWGCAACGGGLW